MASLGDFTIAGTAENIADELETEVIASVVGITFVPEMGNAITTSNVATQTEFVPVLVPLRLLRGTPATEATHPHVYEHFEDMT